jgi:hypothetical protein
MDVLMMENEVKQLTGNLKNVQKKEESIQTSIQ